MSEDYGNDILTLIDEDGIEREYEVLDALEKDDSTYVALIPVLSNPENLEENDGEFIILKVVEDENGEEVLAGIEDEQEFDNVMAEFASRLEDEYEIQS